jgi:beta-lactam-binding protein with PASTA domain
MRRVLLVVLGLALLAGCDAIRSGPTGTSAAVPAVTGKRLADAVTALNGAGFHKVDPTDASAEKRVVVDPENWVVEAQEPAAGSKIDTGSTVTLRVKKPTDGAGSGTVSAGVVRRTAPARAGCRWWTATGW